MNLRRTILIAGALVALAALASMVLVFRWHLGMAGAGAVTGGLAVAVLLISAFIWSQWLGLKRGRLVVEKWAAAHDYQALECKGPFWAGAFSFWTTSRGQVVYFVTVRDRAGQERSAWVRCGNSFWGVLCSDDVEVKWDRQKINAAN